MVHPLTGILVGTKMENLKQDNTNEKDSYMKECYEHAKRMLRQIDLNRDMGVVKPTERMERQKYQNIIDSYIAHLQGKAATAAETKATTSSKQQPAEETDESWALAQDKLCLALACDSKYINPVDPVHWPVVETKLRELIMEKLLTHTNNPIPRFQKCGVYKGFVLIQCNDNYTKDMLNQCVAKMKGTLPGMHLTVIRAARIDEISRRNARRNLRAASEILNSSCETVTTKTSDPLEGKETRKSNHQPPVAEIPSESEQLRYNNAKRFLDYVASLQNLNENQLSLKTKIENIAQEYEKRYITKAAEPIEGVENEVKTEKSSPNFTRDKTENARYFAQSESVQMYQENDMRNQSKTTETSSRSTYHNPFKTAFDRREEEDSCYWKSRENFELPSSSRSAQTPPQCSNYKVNEDLTNDLMSYYPPGSPDRRVLVSKRALEYEQQRHHQSTQNLETLAGTKPDDFSDRSRNRFSSSADNFYTPETFAHSRNEQSFLHRENYELEKGNTPAENYFVTKKNTSAQEETFFNRRSGENFANEEISLEKSQTILEKQIFEFLQSFGGETLKSDSTPAASLKRKLETLKKNNPNRTDNEVIILSDGDSDEEFIPTAVDKQKITHDYNKAIDYLRKMNVTNKRSFSDAEKLHIEICRQKVDKYDKMLRAQKMDRRLKRSYYSENAAKRSREEPSTSQQHQTGLWKSDGITSNNPFRSSSANIPVDNSQNEDAAPPQTNSDLQIAIVDRNHVGFKIPRDSWLNIQKRLLEHLAEEMDRTGNTQIGMFNGAYWQHGIKIIQCENLESLHFIKRSISRQDINETSMQLDVMPVKELPHRSIVKVSIPSTSLDDNAIIKILKAQNYKLYSGDWTLINGRDSHNKQYRELYISVTSASLERLKMRKGEIRYGINTLKIVSPDGAQLK